MSQNNLASTTINPVEKEKIRKVLLAIYSDAREDIIQSNFYDYQYEINRLNGSYNKEYEKICTNLYYNWEKHYYQDM